MTVRLAGALPDADHNGLAAIAAELARDPTRTHVVIAVVDCSRVTTDTDTGEQIPTARVRHVEVVPPADHATAHALLTRLHEERTGRSPLAFDTRSRIVSEQSTGDADGA